MLTSSVDHGYYSEPRLEFGTHLRLLAAAGVRMSGRALDVGCGEGHFGRLLLDAGFSEVVGLEPHSGAAAQAQTRLKTVINARFPAAELEAATPFDLVVFADSLEHLVDPWSALDEAARLIAPNGHLLISAPNVSHYSVMLQQLRGRWDYSHEGLLDKGHLRFFTPATLSEALTRAGFRLTAAAQTKSVPERRVFRPAVAALEAWRPHLFWYQMMAVARHA